MAALAMAGLGGQTEAVSGFLDRYRQKLTPLAESPPDYLAHLADMRPVALKGTTTVLREQLPTLISGWAKDAYHPLIRIAYGYEFDIGAEIAAGLAYLKWCGADETVSRLAAHARLASNPDACFSAMRVCATSVTANRNFNACLEVVKNHPAYQEAAVCLIEPLEDMSRRALSVFAATHDFFALHLVTGAHAYRILYPFAGPNRDATFCLGLLAGYAAVGAPDYQDVELSNAGLPTDWLALTRSDEHNIKLAYSASRQAEFFDDARYIEVTANYLHNQAH